jgi:hypothetical protein
LNTLILPVKHNFHEVFRRAARKLCAHLELG